MNIGLPVLGYLIGDFSLSPYMHQFTLTLSLSLSSLLFSFPEATAQVSSVSRN